MIDLKSVRIESARLLQIPITMNYSSEIFMEFTTEIVTYMFPKVPATIADTELFITDSLQKLEEGSDLQLVILDKITNDFIGCCGLHGLGKADPELGIWTKKSSHGNGYGREAITALIEWAKEHVVYDYLKYPVDKRNNASRKIPEANKGIIKREFKQINQSGFELDEVEYWILAERGNR